MDIYYDHIKKLGGLEMSMNTFLAQEVQRLQTVIAKVRFMLGQLRLAIKGEVVLTNELVDCISDLFDGKVPKPWLTTIAGDEFSWMLPTLGSWFMSLLMRNEQNSKWLEAGRPNSYWLTGFFNPQGFLTAMKQEVTRGHKADQWALDQVYYHSEITNFESIERITSPPNGEGVYVHGLFLDGARWSGGREGSLEESEPKVLFDAIPVLYITATTQSELAKQRREMFGPRGPYMCPLYKYPARTDRYYVEMISLSSRNQPPEHWILRGVALLCSKD